MLLMKVENFSCIKSASVELGPITLLIGPQASGKSVITKLLYFFNDILEIQYEQAEDGSSFLKFKNALTARFKEWFPISAWGKGGFTISFESGNDLHYKVTRRKKTKRFVDDVDIEISPFFENQYTEMLKNMSAARKRDSSDDDENFFGVFDKVWRVRRTSAKILSESLKSDYVGGQTFIPAGRSFFTNLGKAVAILDHSNQLDEMTRDFGRTFASLIDGNRVFYGDKLNQKANDFLKHQKNLSESLFQGSIRITPNDRHVDTGDGRKISFSILSSGQQELLPLLLILQQKSKEMSHFSDRSAREMIYVEEPEAHLFPSTQGQLIEYIASMSSFFRSTCNFLITTHSPYVISKFNNLIKAHIVATLGRGEKRKRVEGIIDARSWLPPASVKAYSLDNGVLCSIKDDSGLINGEYLDQISEDISEKFLSLLEVETEYVTKPLLPTQQQIKNKSS